MVLRGGGLGWILGTLWCFKYITILLLLCIITYGYYVVVFSFWNLMYCYDVVWTQIVTSWISGCKISNLNYKNILHKFICIKFSFNDYVPSPCNATFLVSNWIWCSNSVNTPFDFEWVEAWKTCLLNISSKYFSSCLQLLCMTYHISLFCFQKW